MEPAAKPPRAGALTGLRVLDFSTLLPGPYATMMLADLGAEVVRVEAPGRRDMVRDLPPFDGDVSAAHAYLNRSKQSIAIDLKQPGAPDVVMRLAGHFDVLVEQFRPGVMARFGLGYDALAARHPRLVYCSITGYGHTGPWRDRAGHDINYLAIAGVASYCGRRDDGPVPMPVQVADVAGGSLHAVIGILAALAQRERTGNGQHVDISMTDAAFSLNALAGADFLACGIEPRREGIGLNGGTFYDYYETRDGAWVSVGSLEPAFLGRLGEALGMENVVRRAYDADLSVRAALKTEIAALFLTRDRADWERVFADLDACVEPVLGLAEAATHPQLTARDMIVGVPRPDGTRQQQLACPIRFSDAGAEPRHIGVPLGANGRNVLTDAGFGSEEIDTLVSAGIVQFHP